MATTLHTFIDIFDTEMDYQGEMVQLKKIIIPIIQRDYAQGRKGADTDRVRSRFLDALYQAVTEAPITLDFVYGDINNGIMTPLDGQQRLTTLFLLHWYAAKICNVDPQEYEFLKNFSYETRYSARNFCSLLVTFNPTFTESISVEVIDQPWFPLDWKKDQTVSSMLTMLDAIHEKFADVPELWEKLKEKTISFYFLPIKDMGLTDELYIKMNSRGKPLTLFEHFKAELEHKLRAIDPEESKRILHKVDLDWTDMLWQYRGEDNIIDDEFLRYFRFVCDVLCYRAGKSPQGRSGDEFDLLDEYFSADSDNVLENIKVLEEMFDCWCGIQDCTPAEFLGQYTSNEYEAGKVKIGRYQVDIFADCLSNYADIIGGRNRKFPLNRIVMLYATVAYLLHREDISEEQFVRRLRVVNNLTQNSEDEVSDSENRSSGNRMPAILKQVDSIMIHGVIDDATDKSFNPFQIEEEKKKLQWCADHPEAQAALFELEDHDLLSGQVSIVGLDHPEHFGRFIELMDCDWDAVDCALLACGDYRQTDRNGWRHQLGSSSIDAAWRNLFHNSANSGYDRTQAALSTLLSKSDTFTTEFLQTIAKAYVDDCEARMEFDWRYYYIKYESFRLGRYGKYIWDDYANKPYEILAMWTNYSWSSNAREPFLYEIDEVNINRDDNGQTLLYGDVYVTCENDAFGIYKLDTDEELDRIPVAQNDNGIDIENRITLGSKKIRAAIEKIKK